MSVACRPKVAMQRCVLARRRAFEEALRRERIRVRASAAVEWEVAWEEVARARRAGSAVVEEMGAVSSWDMEREVESSEGVRKWSRREGSRSGRAGKERGVSAVAVLASASGVVELSECVEMASGERSRSAGSGSI